MRKSVSRWAAIALIAVLGIAVSAPPAMADSLVSPPHKTSLTTLSPASIDVLRAESSASVRAQQSGTSSGSFFGTARGKLAIALMAAGVAFAIYTQHDTRKDVKSPVR